MEAHVKGIALPEAADPLAESPYRAKEWSAGKRKPKLKTAAPDYDAVRGQKRWERSYEVLEVVRGGGEGGITTDMVAKQMRLPEVEVLGLLTTLFKRRFVNRTESEERMVTWSVPKKQLKAHIAALVKQSAEAMEWLRTWTISSISARMKNGVEVKASYPYFPAPVENSSSTTAPLT